MRTLAQRSIYYVAVLPFGLLDLIFIFMMELKIIVSPAQKGTGMIEVNEIIVD